MAPLDTFRTRTDRRRLTHAQIVTALLTGTAAVVSLVNLVWLPFAADKGDRVFMTVVMLVMAIAGTWLFWRLRGWQQHELVIDGSGITYTGRQGDRSWRWSEIRSLAVVHGVNRTMAIEDVVDDEQRAAPRLDAAARALNGFGPLDTLIVLNSLEADEIDVLNAVRQHSDGRFPDPERRGPKLPWGGRGVG